MVPPGRVLELSFSWVLTAAPERSVYAEHVHDTLCPRSLERSPTAMNTQIPQDLQVRHGNSMPAEFSEGREHRELSGKLPR